MATLTPPPVTPSRPSTTIQPKPTFYPSLPWLSVPDAPFPPRASHKKRRRALVPSTEEGLAFPVREQPAAESEEVKKGEVGDSEERTSLEDRESQASTMAAGSDLHTPSTSRPASESDSTHPTTPSSSMPPPAPPATTSHTRTATIPAIPLIPIKSVKPASVTSTAQKSVKSPGAKEEPKKAEVALTSDAEAQPSAEETPKASPPPKAAPKSWAELARALATPAVAQAPATANGVVTTDGPAAPKSSSLADVLASYSVYSDKKVSFLEPRGLVNSGNLCYMNSVGYV
jgi:ubiquitin carboxyl-terminal hydrolase 10